MKLHTDHAFHIGKRHLTGGTPCQDYAISGTHGDGAYAIVSDGCSTGGHTDIGARFVAHAMKMELTQCPTEHGLLAGLQKKLPSIPNEFGLEERDLLATCVSVYVTPERAVIHTFGDGACAVVYDDGSIEMHRYEWNKNAPFYPVYYRSDESYRVFLHLHSDTNKPVTHHYARFALDRTERSARMRSCYEGVFDLIERRSADRGPHIKAIEYVAVFTDGVTQVDGMHWEDVVKQLLALKTVEESFAKRRLMAFVRNAEKNGLGCLDDIAYAVVRFERGEEDGKSA